MMQSCVKIPLFTYPGHATETRTPYPFASARNERENSRIAALDVA